MLRKTTGRPRASFSPRYGAGKQQSLHAGFRDAANGAFVKLALSLTLKAAPLRCSKPIKDPPRPLAAVFSAPHDSPGPLRHSGCLEEAASPNGQKFLLGPPPLLRQQQGELSEALWDATAEPSITRTGRPATPAPRSPIYRGTMAL